MPCKDSSARMTVRLDAEDRLRDYTFHKITCNRNIGVDKTYHDLCAGQPVSVILDTQFGDLIERLNLLDTEDQFLTYLEWDALRSALQQYVGQSEGVEMERYRIASIDYSEAGNVEINLVIYPPQELPRIESCLSRTRKESRD
ncbi:hypothetical protein NITGR_720025 [Nitrospina gracilis 3/211]|uniref:Uncharacterized protein n=1 Tax=Nitrospina gracilis (strain 3/211) TaxID=1266370 RepID=M1Z0N0_NITG3|nr:MULTISPECIES: hypothetical protein [Nitrospina]MCF8724378.1 hypothetical protein [Nitrospina sp. Nb-3]CCQ91532.1 hypothetical protein NITGR_720025 [Nitrospina gracilis 3/211]